MSDHFCREGGVQDDQLYMTTGEQRDALVAAGFSDVRQVVTAGTLVMPCKLNRLAMTGAIMSRSSASPRISGWGGNDRLANDCRLTNAVRFVIICANDANA